MELELGLSLATHGSMPWLDLNKEWLEPKGFEGSKGLSHDYTLHGGGCGYKRKKIDEERVDSQKKKLFPLVSWNNEDDEDDLGNKRNCQLVPSTKDFEDENKHTKGWPPIESWRKRFLPSYHDHHELDDRHQTSMNHHYRSSHNHAGSKSTYIKVKMEGVAIGRKINIRCYDSYDCLFNALTTMFAKYINNGDDTTMSSKYTLKFQDREGNLLHARDVSWWTLIGSVQRVEIQRNNVFERS